MERLDDYADDTKDAEITAFINEARPKLAAHRSMSEALHKRLERLAARAALFPTRKKLYRIRLCSLQCLQLSFSFFLKHQKPNHRNDK